jgi:4-hydroxybenzoate polyprenyltransferase
LRTAADLTVDLQADLLRQRRMRVRARPRLVISPRTLTRAQLWWSPKVLPLLAAASLSALAAGASAHEVLPSLAALLISAVGLGSYAHLINDWADVRSDGLAQKPNQLAPVPTWLRALLVASALALGLAPWWFVPLALGSWWLLAALVVLPLVYSARPCRLKGRALAGALADALNAHVLPVAFAMLLAADGAAPGALWRFAFASALVWSAAFGFRSIVVHQLADGAADRAARVRTFVVRHGAVRATVVGRRAFGVEVVSLVALWGTVAWLAPLAGAFLAGYLLLWVLNLKWNPRPFNPTPRQPDAWMPLAEFYEVWPALALAGALTAQDLDWWPLPVALGLLFTGPIIKQSTDLWHLVVPVARDLWHNLVPAVLDLWHKLGPAARAFGFWLRRTGRSGWNRAGVVVRAAIWKVRDVPWHLRVLWYDGWVGRGRYAIMRVTRRQGRRFRRIVLRRHPHVS